MKRKLLPLLVLVLAIVGATAWWIARGGGGPRGIEKSGATAIPLPNETDSPLSADVQSPGSRSAARGEPASLDPIPLGMGTLRLRVLDEKTRAPIPDLRFEVSREAQRGQQVARGRTDAAGRAELREVAADTLLVRTERKPPHASRTGAIVLPSDETKELEILVGAGSAITGRVVDDLQQPTQGAGVRFSLGSNVSAPPAAVSGVDGRFRVDCVEFAPRLVHAIDGELRADGLQSESLEVRLGWVFTRVQAQPDPGNDVDVGDVVLPRAASYAGRVVDAAGQPLAGALFSRRPGRDRSRGEEPLKSWAPLGDPAFELHADEQLTDAGGHFETRGDSRGFMVFVQTPAGQSQRFRLPALQPGERKEDIELRLDPLTALELELLDTQGELVRGKSLAIETYDEAGSRWSGSAGCAADGLWRVDVHRGAADIAVLELELEGYARVHDEVAGRIRAGAHLRYVLTRLPRLHVRLMPKNSDWKPLREPGVQVELHVCLASPAQRKSEGWLACCGLGCFWKSSWLGEPRALELCVKRNAPFWVYAGCKDWNEQVQTVATFGPFVPGEEMHELALDAHDFMPRPGPPEPAGAEAQTVARVSKTPHRGRILRENGEPLADAYVIVQPAASAGSTSGRTLRTDADGRFEFAGELPSKLLLRVSHRLMRDPADRLHELQLYALEAWPADEVLELRFAKPRTVVVSVAGLDPESSDLCPGVCPAPGEPTATCDHRSGNDPAHSPLELGVRMAGPHAAPQRYRFLLAPGRYQLWGSNLMHELPVTDLDVTPGDEDLELTLEAR